MADQLKVEPNILRVAKKQIYWDNVPGTLPEEYYKRSLVIFIVDRFISEMTNCKFWEKTPQVHLIIIKKWTKNTPHILRNLDNSQWCILFTPRGGSRIKVTTPN